MVVIVGYVRRVNPRVDAKVKNVLFVRGKETIYKTVYGDDLKARPIRNLGIYVKALRETGRVVYGEALVDYFITVDEHIREGGEVKIKRVPVFRVAHVTYYLIPRIHGSGEITNVVVFLSPFSIVRLVEETVSKVTGLQAFLRVKFNFSRYNEPLIRQEFDDIVVLSSKGVVDDRITSLRVSGSRLYETNEYSKGFTGKVNILGVLLRGRWFKINSEGHILTYESLSTDVFVDYVKEIISRLLRAGAVVL